MISRKKRLLFERQAQIVQALGHPLRIAILDFLKDGEQCVCDIAEYIGSERSNVSRHLAVLTVAGVVESRKDGLKVMYKLKTPCILEFFECTTKCLKQQVKDGQELLSAM